MMVSSFLYREADEEGESEEATGEAGGHPEGQGGWHVCSEAMGEQTPHPGVVRVRS